MEKSSDITLLDIINLWSVSSFGDSFWNEAYFYLVFYFLLLYQESPWTVPREHNRLELKLPTSL